MKKAPRQLFRAGFRKTILAGLAFTATAFGITDAVEICCNPKSSLTQECQERGLTMERISIENGYNLSTKKGFDLARERIKQLKPKKGWLSLPCTLWTSITNFNFKDAKSREQLERDRQRDRRRVKYGCILLLDIIDGGGDVYYERPQIS